MTEAEISKKLGDLEASLTAAAAKQEELEKVNKRLEAVVKLSAEERVVFDALPVEKQDAYLAADAEARKNMGPGDDDEDDDNPTVTKRLKEQADAYNVELAKRDKEIAVIKKRAEEAEEVAKAERDARERTEFAKRAETELGNYPAVEIEKGDKKEKLAHGDLLRALHSGVSKCLTTEQVEGLSKLLAAGNAALGQLQHAVGRDGDVGKGGSAWSRIEAKAAELRKNDPKLTLEAATAEIMKREPELVEKYREEAGARA